MTKHDLIKFIEQSTTLLETATPQQRERIRELVRESYRKLRESTSVKSSQPSQDSGSSDYLPEK